MRLGISVMLVMVGNATILEQLVYAWSVRAQAVDLEKGYNGFSGMNSLIEVWKRLYN